MIEILLWVYIAICLSLILFQCAFIAIMAIRAHIERRAVRRIVWELVWQLELISVEQPISEEHRAFLANELRLTTALYHYNKALQQLQVSAEDGVLFLRKPEDIITEPDGIARRAPKAEEDDMTRAQQGVLLTRKLFDRYFTEYIRQSAPAVVSLTAAYRKKDTITQSFYVFVLKHYSFLRHYYSAELIANLRDLIEMGDCVCCEGVLLAVYQIGDPVLTLEILKQIDDIELFLHPKIISDGLLSFSGDVPALQHLIFEQLSTFSVAMQVNLLTYVRFASGAHCVRVLELLQDEQLSDEVRFSCIRYFGKHAWQPAYELLARFAMGESGGCVEYAIVALTALRRYPCERTVEILRAQIKNTNWFIRYNATESMESLGIEYQDLIDIFDGTDRYAREMLQYQFDQRYILDREV